jgi:hypothetical protein
MEKFNFKDMEKSKEFQAGLKEFKEGKIKNESVKCGWYRAKVPTKKWNDYYSKVGSYTFLGGDKNDTYVGFLAVNPPAGCLEITETDELLKIDAHRRATNHMPFVTEDKKYGK